MPEEFNIEKILSFLLCAQCGCNFDPECAKILNTGNDTIIIKVTCNGCGKKYALAFMDLTFPMFAQSLDGARAGSDTNFEAKETSKTTSLEDEHCFEENYPYISKKHIKTKNLGKITYDDVLEAHDFIQNFEENWRRYMDKRNLNAI